MDLNVPVAALALVGVILAAAGALMQGGSFTLILFGVAIILFAWILQEASKRRRS